MLMPFGFLLPIILEKSLGYIRIFLFSLLLTAGIELAQFYTGLGEMDIDDVILNVLGSMLGYGLFRLLRATAQRRMHIHT